MVAIDNKIEQAMVRTAGGPRAAGSGAFAYRVFLVFFSCLFVFYLFSLFLLLFFGAFMFSRLLFFLNSPRSIAHPPSRRGAVRPGPAALCWRSAARSRSHGSLRRLLLGKLRAFNSRL